MFPTNRTRQTCGHCNRAWIAGSIGLLSILASPAVISADDGFDELEQLAALWSVADEPYQPITRELDKPPFHHEKVLSVTAASLVDGWVPNRQCHRHFPLFPALQISFRPDAVRNMRIVEHTGSAEAWVEEPTIQMKNTRPDSTLCFLSDNPHAEVRRGHR